MSQLHAVNQYHSEYVTLTCTCAVYLTVVANTRLLTSMVISLRTDMAPDIPVMQSPAAAKSGTCYMVSNVHYFDAAEGQPVMKNKG